MDFKSQICTTREQSERLLALGLKKETADCRQRPYTDAQGLPSLFADALPPKWEDDIPAWSLHRLIEMIAGGCEEQMIFLPDPYDEIIEEIAGAIMVNSFNKEYLE